VGLPTLVVVGSVVVVTNTRTYTRSEYEYRTAVEDERRETEALWHAAQQIEFDPVAHYFLNQETRP